MVDVAPSLCRVKVHLTLAVTGIVIGISSFLVFGLKFQNWHAGSWGLVSGVFATLTLYVHIQYMREIWKTWTYRLKYFIIIGCSCMLVAIVGFVAYVTLGAVFHQDLHPNGHNYYLASIWCFMAWKWAFLLFWFSRRYRALYGDEYRLPAYEHI
ncbi:heme transporter hrg1-B-like [Tubulanus polymorphus]|uniref:heme transporter hrg1-B-like n=1 Tax=Tubulanus polymorphus TaxID=672921 RepID=UPI003DA4AD12